MARDRAASAATPAPSERRTPPDREPGSAHRGPVRAALRFALGDAAGRDGLRLWDELPAPPGRLAGGGRLGAAAPSAAGEAVGGRPDRLEQGEPGHSVCPGQKSGSATGPNPTDVTRAGDQECGAQPNSVTVEKKRAPMKVPCRRWW